MNSESELIDDARYAIGKLRKEQIELLHHIDQLEADIRKPAPKIPTEQKILAMSSTERKKLMQARADREFRLRDLQGSRQRLKFIEDELINWQQRLHNAQVRI